MEPGLERRERARPQSPSGTDADHVREAFARETAAELPRRYALCATVFILFSGIAALLDRAISSVERPYIAAFLATEWIALALATVALRGRVPVRRAKIVGAGVLGLVCGIVVIHDLIIPRHAEIAAVTVVCILTGAAVLMPWGARTQALAGAMALAAFAVASPMLLSGGPIVVILVAVLAGVTVSVIAAHLLERHRFDAFVRAHRFEATSLRNREEADISAALVQVGEALSARLDLPDVLERVNRLAVQHLGCDWSNTFVHDGERGMWRLASSFGVSERVAAELRRLEIRTSSFPVIERFRPGEVVELSENDPDPAVPPDVLRRFEGVRVLVAPLWRGHHLVGALAHGYRRATLPFTNRQRRLSLGIASAAAIAVENRRLVEDLQAANHLKSEFVSTMSHELRTPLNTVLGFTDLLLDDEFGALTPGQRDALRRVLRSAMSLRDLIGATLDLGRLDAGRETIIVEPFEVGALLDEICSELELLVPPSLSVLWTNRVGGRAIFADREKVKTILRNLVGNAIKFTPRGVVEVDVGHEQGRLEITVRDTGVGIEPEHLASIFEMFRQADASNSRRFGGVGLGLHIVKRLSERLGGEVTTESSPGVGSVFRVCLPVQIEGGSGHSDRIGSDEVAPLHAAGKGS
jgi:signal transduction histidine kinase